MITPMFERFTPRARHAIVLAQDEARLLGHDYIGTEHLLLGLLGEPESIAGRVLRQLGVTLDPVRSAVEALIGRGDGGAPGHIPFTPRTKKVLELSLREALSLGHNYIGTEHILLGLVRQSEGVAMTVLAERGIAADAVRRLVTAELGKIGAARSADHPERTPAAEEILSTAGELAAGAPLGSHHLLEAIALVDDSAAAGTLADLGVDREALLSAIGERSTAGTSDESPHDVAASQMDVRSSESEVTIVLRDPEAVQLGRKLAEAMGNPFGGRGVAGSPLVGLWRATVAELRRLAELVTPSDEAEPGSRAAQVRRAIRNRLRRAGR